MTEIHGHVGACCFLGDGFWRPPIPLQFSVQLWHAGGLGPRPLLCRPHPGDPLEGLQKLPSCVFFATFSFFFFLFLIFASVSSQWYNRTDYPIFTQYQRYRMLHPTQPFYILHPRFEWQVWQQIQDNMAEPIQRNPPSSGLLGAWELDLFAARIQHWIYSESLSSRVPVKKCSCFWSACDFSLVSSLLAQAPSWWCHCARWCMSTSSCLLAERRSSAITTSGFTTPPARSAPTTRCCTRRTWSRGWTKGPTATSTPTDASRCRGSTGWTAQAVQRVYL